MQYKEGTVTVTNGSPVVIGSGTRFLGNVVVGKTPPMFMLPKSGAAYTVAEVISDTELHLSAPFAQAGAVNSAYSITKDFTPLLGLPEVAPGDVDWPYLLTQSLRKLDSYMGLSPFNASPFGVIPLCGLDNGANLPGAELQAEIDRLLVSGVPAEKIIWFSTGTETAGSGDGMGSLTGVSVASSVGTIIGAGVSTAGAGALIGVSASTSTGSIGGVGMADGTGLGTLSAVSATTSTGEITGTGIALGTGTLAGVSVATSTGTITGSGNATDGSGTLTGVSVATSTGTIGSNAAPYSTIGFSNFVDAIDGTGSLAGVTATTSTGTITGAGTSLIGTGSLTGVSAVTSTGTIASNAAPYSTISFSQFS